MVKNGIKLLSPKAGERKRAKRHETAPAKVQYLG